MEKYTVSVSNRALTAATTQTIIQLVTGSTRRLKVLEWGVSFDGVTGTAEPVDVEMLLQTTAGTSSAGTNVALDAASPASIGTSLITFTAEPTAGAVLGRWMVHPQGGLMVMQYALDREPRIGVSSRIGWRCTAAAGVNVDLSVTFEE